MQICVLSPHCIPPYLSIFTFWACLCLCHLERHTTLWCHTTITAWVASDAKEAPSRFPNIFFLQWFFGILSQVTMSMNVYLYFLYFLSILRLGIPNQLFYILLWDEIFPPWCDIESLRAGCGALLNKLMMNNKWLILSSCEPWRPAQSEKNIIRNTGIYSRGPKSLILHRQ